MPWPFQLFDPSAEFSAPEYGELLDEVRGMLAALAHAAPGPDLTRALTADVQLWRKELEARRVEDDEAPYGQLHMRDDHAIAALPEIVLHHDAPDLARATVTFSRWHVGGGGTVHGGQVAAALDELMGRAQVAGGWIARTAYLNVNYRAGTPWDRPLEVEVRVPRVEGRKHFVEARLFDETTTYAEADALFIRVAPYPGAPTTDPALANATLETP